MSKKAESPVHIEWSHDWVRAANISTGQTAEAETIAGLGSILSGARDAIVGVSRKHVFLKTVRLPKAAPEDLRRILAVQLGQIFPLPLDQLAFDFIQTNDIDSEGCLTLVGAIRSDDLRRLRAEMLQAGIAPSRVLPIALASPAVAAEAGLADALVAENDLGGAAFDIVKGGILRFSRMAPTTSDPDCEAVRTMAAARSGELSRVTTADIALPDARKVSRTTLALLGQTLPFAFILTEDRENAIRQAVASRTRLAGMMMAAAVLLALLVAVNRIEANGKAQQAQATWSRMLVKLNSRHKEASDSAGTATQIGSSLDVAFNPAQPLSDIVSVVADSLPKGAWLDELSVERGKPADIRGTAQTSQQVDQFVRNLGSNPRFRDVHLVFANSATIGKVPVVQFNVDATCVGNLPMPAPVQITGTRTATTTAAAR